MSLFFAQLPQLPPGELERWLASAAAVGGLALLWLRLTGRKPANAFVSREEFREFRASVEAELSGLRERIDSRHLAVIENLEKVQASLLSDAERRAASLHRRLGDVEAGLARLDERTKRGT